MIIPPEFVGRVYKTGLTGYPSNFSKFEKIQKEWPGSYIDVVYEGNRPIILIIFEQPEDCTVFAIKYGREYE